MKNSPILFFLALALMFSCSSDNSDDNGVPAVNAIVGTWDLTRIEIDETVDDDDLDFAKGIVDVLVAQNCDLLTLVFNEDGSLTITQRDFDDIEIDLTGGGTGLSLTCPETQSTSSADWTLDGDQLTVTFEDQTQETVTVNVNGNTLTADADFVDEENLAGADAVFAKR
ncbi:lipocalin family protein [Spongiimicrobium sp. 3-5]|uniref:lipocalin family protein n=1 Tax=Spongiimicrobium sp. 3-5 TaxID=3332596 RepID=UPI003980DF54